MYRIFSCMRIKLAFVNLYIICFHFCFTIRSKTQNFGPWFRNILYQGFIKGRTAWSRYCALLSVCNRCRCWNQASVKYNSQRTIDDSKILLCYRVIHMFYLYILCRSPSIGSLFIVHIHTIHISRLTSNHRHIIGWMFFF